MFNPILLKKYVLAYPGGYCTKRILICNVIKGTVFDYIKPHNT